MLTRRTALISLAVTPFSTPVFAQPAGRYNVTRLFNGLENPWGLAFLPDGQMLVTERPGRLRLLAPDGRPQAVVTGTPEVFARGQGGLLDICMDADFASNRLVYMTYAEARDGGAATSAVRSVLSLDGKTLSAQQVIFRQQPASSGSLHFGSRIVPARDGTLFIALGERGQKEKSQDLATHYGKVVRITPDGAVPPDNPFVNSRDVRPEIYSYGHRNIQGAALHPQTGQLWTVEHGARGGDEINKPAPGRNYGWPIITYGRDYSGQKIGEGTHKTGMEQPYHYWDPSIAPSGMMFYSGDLFPEWKGNLFIAALAGSLVSRLVPGPDKVMQEERILSDLGHRFRDIRQGPDGAIYLLTDDAAGELLRVSPAR